MTQSQVESQKDNTSISPVLFGLESLGARGLGTIELNRPSVLNALNTQAYELLEARLRDWLIDDQVAAVLLSATKGAKAFCAGGDVKGLMLKTKQSGLEIAKEFFTREYFVDGFMHHYKKPVVALCDGITMGGGLGLAAGAFYRIATERTLAAMPELSIGLFPDVGATRFLQNVQAPYGLFMGLTGARLNGADAVRIGLMDGFLPSEKIRHLRADLLRVTAGPDVESIRTSLKSAIDRHCTKPSYAMTDGDRRIIENAFSRESLLEIDAAFMNARGLSPWLEETRARYAVGSPLSRSVFFAAWHKHKGLSIVETLKREWEMAIHFSKNREFAEGVRAVLIDKDHAPRWSYSRLTEVPTEAVEACFHSGESKNLLAEKFSEFGW